jgi:hypothetical protein
MCRELAAPRDPLKDGAGLPGSRRVVVLEHQRPQRLTELDRSAPVTLAGAGPVCAQKRALGEPVVEPLRTGKRVQALIEIERIDEVDHEIESVWRCRTGGR